MVDIWIKYNYFPPSQLTIENSFTVKKLIALYVESQPVLFQMTKADHNELSLYWGTEKVQNDFPATFLISFQSTSTNPFYLDAPNNIDINHLVLNGLPPIGRKLFGLSSKSTTRKKSVYDFEIQTVESDFGLLNLKYNLFDVSTIYNSPMFWSSESDLQQLVSSTFIDCIRLIGLQNDLITLKEETFFIKSFLNQKHFNRPEFIFRNMKTNLITGVCEVKSPKYDLDDSTQLIDYMIDLRNSHLLRHVFGVLTTYEKWRVFWFEDSEKVARISNREEYDYISQIGSASDYTFSSCNSKKITVFKSRIYNHSDPALVNVLATFLYKSYNSPIATPNQFIGHDKLYVLLRKSNVLYSLLGDLSCFTYEFPDRAKEFYILQYYHRGGDGRVALGCSRKGNLCVMKILLESENEKEMLQQESGFWQMFWNTKTRILQLADRFF